MHDSTMFRQPCRLIAGRSEQLISAADWFRDFSSPNGGLESLVVLYSWVAHCSFFAMKSLFVFFIAFA